MTTAFNSLGEIDSEAGRAARIIESVVGNAWATDAAGKFTYVTPATLSLLGMTLEDFNSPVEQGPSGWRSGVVRRAGSNLHELVYRNDGFESLETIEGDGDLGSRCEPHQQMSLEAIVRPSSDRRSSRTGSRLSDDHQSVAGNITSGPGRR
ncbi:PAS domain-containing protein [Sinorhizobium sp. 8-89]|uniref:PAS domain-containing protein n=1 Tax=Sinorhizobium sp. 7-81 TaxID=3049087 RepID=UPI0024C3C681|nr:PAS domain-containing protein [Sinorhizobium sp. 7-81]MDK1388769.1 PAS domain-containing protein [Sinorhizobium sp. 7-81]